MSKLKYNAKVHSLTHDANLTDVVPTTGENNFSGSMPTEICDLKNGGGALEVLFADCDIVCTCCTACYSPLGSLQLLNNNTANDIFFNATVSFNTTCNYTKPYLC